MAAGAAMANEHNKPLEDRQMVLCVTGGIACYKSADLASKLVQSGAGVTVAMTEAATRFVAPLTFQALTGRQVYTSLWQGSEDFCSQHISLTEAADLMIVAPATANIIGKMAAGLADDLVSSLALSASGACPILIAPAMNERMWSSPAVQANVKRLTERGVQAIGPTEGYLACGTIGQGRMAEPTDILQAARQLLATRPLKKLR